MNEYHGVVMDTLDEVAKKPAFFDQSKDATATGIVIKCAVGKKPKGLGIPSP